MRNLEVEKVELPGQGYSEFNFLRSGVLTGWNLSLIILMMKVISIRGLNHDLPEDVDGIEGFSGTHHDARERILGSGYR